MKKKINFKDEYKYSIVSLIILLMYGLGLVYEITIFSNCTGILVIVYFAWVFISSILEKVSKQEKFNLLLKNLLIFYNLFTIVTMLILSKIGYVLDLVYLTKVEHGFQAMYSIFCMYQIFIPGLLVNGIYFFLKKKKILGSIIILISIILSIFEHSSILLIVGILFLLVAVRFFIHFLNFN